MFALLRTPGLYAHEWCLQTTDEWPVFDPHRKALWERISKGKRVCPVFPTSRSKGDRYVFDASGVAEVIQYAKENELSVLVQFPFPYGLDAAYKKSRRTTLFAEHLLHEWLPLPASDASLAWSQLTLDEISLVVGCPSELSRLNKLRPFATPQTRFAFLHGSMRPPSEMDMLSLVFSCNETQVFRVHPSAMLSVVSPPHSHSVLFAKRLPYECGRIPLATLPTLTPPPNAQSLVFLFQENGAWHGLRSPLTSSPEQVPCKHILSPSVPSVFYIYDTETETWMSLSYQQLRALFEEFRGIASQPTDVLIHPCLSADHVRFQLQRSLSSVVVWEMVRGWDDAMLERTRVEVEANQRRIHAALEGVRADLRTRLPRWVHRPRSLRLELPVLSRAELQELERRFVVRGWSIPVVKNAVPLAHRFGAPTSMTALSAAQRFLLEFSFPRTLEPHQAIRLGELFLLASPTSSTTAMFPVPASLRPYVQQHSAFYPPSLALLQNYGNDIWSHLRGMEGRIEAFPEIVTSYMQHVLVDHRTPADERWTLSNRAKSGSLFALFHALSLTTPFSPPPIPSSEDALFQVWFSFLGQALLTTTAPVSSIMVVHERTRFSVLSTDDPFVRFAWLYSIQHSQRTFYAHSPFGQRSLSQLTSNLSLLRSKKLHCWMNAVEDILPSFPPELQAMELHALCSLLWVLREVPLFEDLFHQATRAYIQRFLPSKQTLHRSASSRMEAVTLDLFPLPGFENVSPIVASLLGGSLTVSHGGLLD